MAAVVASELDCWTVIIGGAFLNLAPLLPRNLFAAGSHQNDHRETAVKQIKERRVMATFKTKDGAEIFYNDWGAGDPIVFSHGWRRRASGILAAGYARRVSCIVLLREGVFRNGPNGRAMSCLDGARLAM
jgi:hypothetical protein